MTKKQIFGLATFAGAIALMNIVGFSLRLASGSPTWPVVLLITVGLIVLVGAACLAYYVRPSKWDRGE